MNSLPPQDIALIEAMKKYASLETKGLLSIITKLQAVNQELVRQRDAWHRIGGCDPETKADEDEQIQAILGGRE